MLASCKGRKHAVLSEDDVARTLSILKDMIGIPTTNPPGENYERFAKYAAELLKSVGMEVEVIEVPEDLVEACCPECRGYRRFIVVGRAGSGRPVVQFNGHYDVVPPGPGWSLEPFVATAINGRVYGRGAVDMKGGIAAMVVAVKKFVELVKDFKGTVEVVLVPDEEIGGDTGTGYLLRSYRRPDYAIIGEPSGLDEIWVGHKGILWGFVEVYGKQSHGSTPWRGVNAFELMCRLVTRFLEAYKPVLEQRRSSYDYGDEEGAKPTINVGGEVKGGVKVNVVPGYYAFSFDRRVIPEEDINNVEAEIREMVLRVAKEMGVKCDVKIVNKVRPAITKPDSPLVLSLRSSAEDVLGIKPRALVCLGGLDLHYYTSAGVDAVAYGPGPEECAHVTDEYVLVSEVIGAANVYLHLLQRILSAGSG